MTELDLRLHLVTDRALCGERGVPTVVAAAVAGGVTVVQLRDPTAPGRDLLAAAEELVAQLAGTGVPLIVDDRVDIALAAGAAGVHLGQRDLPSTHARAIAGAGLVIGWSVSSLAEAAAAQQLPVQYLGVGPVRATATKPDAAAPTGLEGLAAICSSSALPCVAIGGVDAGLAAAAVRAGCAGVAVVSAVCAAVDPEAAARELRAALG